MSDAKDYGEPWRVVGHYSEVQDRNRTASDQICKVEGWIVQFFVDNADELIAALEAHATLAAKDAEIARLRAEVERLRGTLAGILEKAKWMRDFSSQPHQIKSWDVVAQFAFNALGEPSLAELRVLTAALADTADKPKE